MKAKNRTDKSGHVPSSGGGAAAAPAPAKAKAGPPMGNPK
jgi:hypothetical protein